MAPLPRPTVLLLDCDNTLTLTEENAFAATSETINTLLADFKIPAVNPSSGDGTTALTTAALQSLNLGSSADATVANTSNASNAGSDSDSDEDDSEYKTYSAPALLASYIGLPFRQILISIASRHEITLSPIQLRHYISLEEANVNRQITLHSPPAEDVLSTLQSLHTNGTFKHIAVVSSSPLPRMKTALAKAGLYPSIFNDQHLFSASDSLFQTPTPLDLPQPKPQHKPHPAVYLHAILTLGVKAEDCLAVEDSVSGTLSAVRAGIRVWGYVGAYHDPAKRSTMGRILLQNGAEKVFGEWSGFLGSLGEAGYLGTIGEQLEGWMTRAGFMDGNEKIDRAGGEKSVGEQVEELMRKAGYMDDAGNIDFSKVPAMTMDDVAQHLSRGAAEDLDGAKGQDGIIADADAKVDANNGAGDKK